MIRRVLVLVFLLALPFAVLSSGQHGSVKQRRPKPTPTPLPTPTPTPVSTPTPPPGTGFYASPNGSSSADGSLNNPWDLQTALNRSVQPGTTIWLRGGTYAGIFSSQLTGTAQAPILVRQYPGERATIDGQTVDANILTINGAYAWYWGFEITNSSTNIGSSAGITMGNSVGVKLINLVIHDMGTNGIGAWSESSDTEIYGCLIYFVGRVLSDNHGYHIYAQNQIGQKYIEENILIHGFGGYSTHIYGSETAYLDNFRLIGNVTYPHWNLIGGGRKAQNPVYRENFFVTDDIREGVFDLGWFYAVSSSQGVNNAEVRDNYFVGKAAMDDLNTGTVCLGNTFYGYQDGFTPADFPSNTYFTSRPTGVWTFVRPNRYEARANIVVFNWDGLSTVPVNVSSILQVGDRYEVRDSQNYHGPVIQSGVYGGGSISLPVTSTAIATPVTVPSDRSAPVHTGREFGVYILIRSAN